MRSRIGLSVVLLALAGGSGSGSAQQASPWSIGAARTRDLGLALTAAVFGEPASSEAGAFALTLTCSLDGRRVSLSSAHALPWETSTRDPAESFLPLQISSDDRPSQRVALLRESEGTGRIVPVSRVLRGDREPPNIDELLKRALDWFDKSWIAARRVTVSGLAWAPIEFRFDTLTGDQRERLRKACFELDERRAAEARCKSEARGRVRHEFEDALFDAKRAWCDTTRQSRRDQLVNAFVRGVSAARNGGARLAAAFEAFITANPDVIVADGRGATQSCPDTHFTIDVARLQPVLERQTTGGALSAAAAERHLAELLKESGIVASTVQLKLMTTPPDLDARALDEAIAKAERQCVAGEAGVLLELARAVAEKE